MVLVGLCSRSGVCAISLLRTYRTPSASMVMGTCVPMGSQEGKGSDSSHDMLLHSFLTILLPPEGWNPGLTDPAFKHPRPSTLQPAGLAS